MTSVGMVAAPLLAADKNPPRSNYVTIKSAPGRTSKLAQQRLGDIRGH
jgi:hypothetical protein